LNQSPYDKQRYLDEIQATEAGFHLLRLYDVQLLCNIRGIAFKEHRINDELSDFHAIVDRSQINDHVLRRVRQA
jgi:hypothetical protein